MYVVSLSVSTHLLQVNLFQKHSFLHQLTQNMTKYCSLNSPKIQVQNMLCTKIGFLFLFWHSKQYLYATCSKLVFFWEFSEQSLVILRVNWFKNETFWHWFTCTAYRLMIQRINRVATGFGPFQSLNLKSQSVLLKHNADLVVSLRGAVFMEVNKQGSLPKVIFLQAPEFSGK